jgi:hypothetical protein
MDLSSVRAGAERKVLDTRKIPGKILDSRQKNKLETVDTPPFQFFLFLSEFE